MSITIHSGSILDSKADCIVNPANSFLNHGGGLARIIEQAATKDPAPNGDYKPEHGEALRDIQAYFTDQRLAPLLATGNAHPTNPGVLPFKRIIQAVGPIWNGGLHHEDALLKDAYSNSCAVAWDEGMQSIAFPAISCGIFGFPAERAAKLAIQAVTFWATPQPDGLGMEVEFWPFGFEHEFKAALS